MHPQATPIRHTFRAFTLVELLAVITIIGILAGILIPVIGSIRESANANRCSSNLRQISIAAQIYSNDHKSVIIPWAPPVGENWWMTSLLRYLGVKHPNSGIVEDSIFMCPTEKPNNKGEISYVEGDIRTRYSLNLHITWDGDPGVAWQRRTVHYNELENAAKTYLVIDLFGPSGGGWWMAPYLVYPHKGRVNVAFIDGHVEAKTREQMDHYTANFNHIFWRGYNWSNSTTFQTN